MGTDVSAVLQKKIRGEWKTIDTDVIPFRLYNLFSCLSDVRGTSPHGPIATLGFPEGFIVDEEGEHEGYWMGDHSFGHFSLWELCNYKVPSSPPQLRTQYRTDNSITISYGMDLEDVDLIYDEYAPLRDLQNGIRYMYDVGSAQEPTYRIVLGYDS